eukprot:CAMPEP_0113634898 /NCGR_PEP_ID=MMETSP0017_2-20120614/18179_1 /TAXON_ID=2856 /ORGANISM="Cylindrotheca closterium" /LENGTH=165 /DNA_ID=CAMNT_0000545631 /DNA_START=33 /DNA_END=527 /DNA_ORIENTATION=- /assembly_acc=CAM_ASM_000147
MLQLQNTDTSAKALSMMLAKAEQAMLIEKCSEDKYRWVHDKVQQAALTLFTSNNDDFMFQLGWVLIQNLSEKELEEELFDVVDLVNKGNDNKKEEFTVLNLRAAKKAKQMSAFHSASRYAAKGIDLLPANKWDTVRQLALELYTIAAEVEYALGNISTSEEYCKV